MPTACGTRSRSTPAGRTKWSPTFRPRGPTCYGYYTVKSGDTLSAIAKKLLGSAGRYMDIFNANKDQLSDPDKIKVGQKLVIPKP